jgi:hypothetical protein
VSGLYNTHLLSLEALLTIIDSIESRIPNEHQGDQQATGMYLAVNVFASLECQ